eukprot:symbB.v1.2.034091.t1/scaffold4322.1/size41248/2
MVLPPLWVTGDMEAPAGTKNMGSWTAKVYTPEQQARLGVDEMGVKVAAASSSAPRPAAAPAQPVGLIGPAWTRGEIEKPTGTKDMGGWTSLVYTAEQQARLGVDESGNKVAAPVKATGPAWTRGEIEKPAGTKDMGGYKAAVYTAEQQERLGVDEDGNKRAKAAAAPAATLPVITAEYAAALLNSDKLLSDMCKKYFHKYDGNQDGFLESNEVGVLCQDLHSGLGIKLTEKDLAESMKPYAGTEAGLKEEDFHGWFATLLKDTVKSQVSTEKPVEEKVELKVKSLNGSETAALCIETSATVAELAKRAAAMLDLPVAKTKIVCDGQVLDESVSVATARLDDQCDLTAVVKNSIKVRRHVYQMRGGAPPYRGYNLVATDEVELEPGKKLGDQWSSVVPDDGYPAPRAPTGIPMAFQSTPSSQVPKKWEGGMNEVDIDQEALPEDVFGVDAEVELAVLVPMRGVD